MTRPPKRCRRTFTYPFQPDEEWKRDVDRRNELNKLRFCELPEEPSADVLRQELAAACASLKAVRDTLSLGATVLGVTREAELVNAAIKLCGPFRAYLLTAAEHCRGATAAILSKRKNGDNLYWMGGMYFCVAVPNTLGNDRYISARKVITDGWGALDIVSELLARLDKASGVHKGSGTFNSISPCSGL